MIDKGMTILCRALLCATITAAVFSGAQAADAVADKEAAPAATPANASPFFDTSLRLSVLSDYVTRGVTGTEGRAAVQGYGEFRVMETFYGGLLVSNVSYPNSSGVGDPKVELDFLAGLRQTWGKFSIDVGGYYSVYPNEDEGYPSIDSGELYVMPSFAVTDSLTVSGSAYWTPDWGGTGAHAIYYSASARYILPVEVLPGVGTYLAGEIGKQNVGKIGGTFDVPNWISWNVGGGFTYKNMTLDIKWTGSNLSKDECLLSQGSRDWCGNRAVVGLSFDF